jgi:glycosyltransferase involved in cell wall biosynthesis
VTHIEQRSTTPATQSGQERDEGRRLRILVVGDLFPWPAHDGYRLRFSSVVKALSDIGDVELFIGAFDGTGDDESVPANLVCRFEGVETPFIRPSIPLALRILKSRLPSRILCRDWEDARESLRRFVRGPYDLIWYVHADSFAVFGDLALGSSVVDLDNLEGNVLRHPFVLFFMKSARADSRIEVLRARSESLARWVLSWRDRVLWFRLQRTIVKEVESVVVCSEVDRRRLKTPRVAVIRNGYSDPGPLEGPVSESLTLVMVAVFTYQPNLAGANWLAHEVLPELRRLVPGVKVRLIGRYDERLVRVAQVPGIEIAGEIPELGPELRSARGAVTPILNGSGTRIKVIEALAYGLPIVTTELGCEGLNIEAGRHALVDSDPTEFAASCAKVLTDDATCERLRENGRRLYLDHFTTDVVDAQIRQIALGAVNNGSRSPKIPDVD